MGRSARTFLVCSLLVSSLVGCSPIAPGAKSTRFEGWDAVELRSSSARVVVVPSIGRIMHFGRIDGPNLLWVSRQFAGKDPAEVGYWQNFGGDKVWPWPQAKWGAVFGRGWPPPRGFDPVPHRVERLADGRLRMTSEPDPTTGYRVVREIELAPDRPCLRVATRMERVFRPGDEPAVMGAWVVSQIMTPDDLFVPVLASATRPWVSMSEEPDPQFVSPAPGGFRIHPRPQAQKAGFDSDRLVAVFGKDRLVHRLLRVSEGDYLDPTDRGQVYAHKHDEQGRAEYVELEFTAPPGEVSELVVEWSIEPIE